MSATVLDGARIAAEVRREVASTVALLTKGGRHAPGLAVVLVGNDPASAVYVRNKQKACLEVGIRTFDHRLGADIAEGSLLALIDRLNSFDDVDGILVQLPLPAHIDSARVIAAINPTKDIDGFHPENLGLLLAGRPRFVACTPAGVMRLLGEAGATLEGAEAVVVGRSAIVGKPVAMLLAQANATVTLCHSKTRALDAIVARAGIVVAAVGHAALIRGEWIRQGAVVIDVGINRDDTGKLIGDVDFKAACERASAISPVPGGVGPMTIAMLCANTVYAARLRAHP